eukprot:9488983-Pyramimonas_sp.AAC.1
MVCKLSRILCMPGLREEDRPMPFLPRRREGGSALLCRNSDPEQQHPAKSVPPWLPGGCAGIFSRWTNRT